VKPAQQGGGTGCLGLLAGEPVVLAGGQAGEPDREMWDDKTILLCYLTGSCVPFPGNRPGPTNIDPALSPDGTYLAFVHGSASGLPENFSQASLNRWYATRGLWVYSLTGGNPHRVFAAGTFAADPTWSAASRLVLYVRDGGLWLINPFSGSPARVVKSLFQGAWPNYYYNVDWRDQFAWSSRR